MKDVDWEGIIIIIYMHTLMVWGVEIVFKPLWKWNRIVKIL